MAAETLPNIFDAFSQAGMDDYLPKPFNAAQIAAFLNKWGA